MAERVRGRMLPHLREWRMYKSYTQSELADMVGVTRHTIMHAEGGAAVGFTTIRAIAEALGITVERLYQAPPDIGSN